MSTVEIKNICPQASKQTSRRHNEKISCSALQKQVRLKNGNLIEQYNSMPLLVEAHKFHVYLPRRSTMNTRKQDFPVSQISKMVTTKRYKMPLVRNVSSEEVNLFSRRLDSPVFTN